jgi:hypothetical protein
MLYLFTVVGLTPGGSSTVQICLTTGGSSTVQICLTTGGSSTVHINKNQYTEEHTRNTQNITNRTIRIHKPNNKNT